MEKDQIKMLWDPKIKEAMKREALKAAYEATKNGSNSEEILWVA